MSNDQQKIEAYNVLVHKLPKPNFHLLKALCGFLVKIVRNSDINKMDIRNLSIVFSPTLNIPTPVILVFLTEFEAIFGELLAGASHPLVEPSTSNNLTAEDIRSPRRQMFSDIPTPAYNQTSFERNQQSGRADIAVNAIHPGQNLGFAPLQPSYNVPGSTAQFSSQSSKLLDPSGAGLAIARPRNLTPEDSNLKQSRRESSMMLMGSEQRKNSLPLMRAEQGSYTAVDHGEGGAYLR